VITIKHKFISKRYWNSIETPMAEVDELVKKYDDIINLSLGDHDFITNQKVIESAFKDAKAGHTKYTDALGQEELRNEIRNFYKEEYNYDIDIDEIMIVVGACHGMFLALEAILDDGDEVIVPEPYFTPYNNQITIARGKQVPLITTQDEDFNIDINRLRVLITNRTKAIIINTPNNPTGTVLRKEVLEGISKVAIENDLIVIADDVYGAFSYREPFIPITTIKDMKERTITVGSFSKDYAMTGWRIGFVLAPKNIIQCMRNINEGVCFSAPSISQRAAIHALRLKDSFQPTMVEEYRKRVYYSYERIKKIPNMSVMEPKGSFYMFINIKKTGLSSAEVSKRILEEAHVLTIPGKAFGESGEGFIRIACTVGIDKLKEAFDRIEKMNVFKS